MRRDDVRDVENHISRNATYVSREFSANPRECAAGSVFPRNQKSIRSIQEPVKRSFAYTRTRTRARFHALEKYQASLPREERREDASSLLRAKFPESRKRVRADKGGAERAGRPAKREEFNEIRLSGGFDPGRSRGTLFDCAPGPRFIVNSRHVPRLLPRPEHNASSVESMLFPLVA